MTIYILLGSVLLLFALYWAFHSITDQQKPQDSMLKQRAIFNINEQLTFTRLKEILPQCIILAHVSYDALLTTKYFRTRHKYRNMVADLVILDEYHQIIAVIAVDDSSSLRRAKNAEYQDALLSMAGYRVVRYDDVPEYFQLRQDFLTDVGDRERVIRPGSEQYALERKKQKALS